MKKTQIIELIKNIKGTLVSFIAITVFIALGIGLFTGLSWSADSLRMSAENTLKNNNFHDFEFTAAYGMSGEEIASLLTIDGVDEVEGLHATYRMVNVGDNPEMVVISEIGSKIDCPYVVEGTLPVAGDEIAVDNKWASRNGVKVGDSITLENSDNEYLRTTEYLINADAGNMNLEELEDIIGAGTDQAYLKNDVFRVTALVSSPLYTVYSSAAYGVESVSNLQISCFMMVTGDAWDDSLDNVFQKVVIRSDSLRKYRYLSKEYNRKATEISKEIETMAGGYNDVRFAVLQDNIAIISARMGEELANAKKELEDGHKQIEYGKKQIEDGRKQIKDAEEKLGKARTEIDSGWTELQSGEETLMENEALLAENEAEYQETKIMFDDLTAFGDKCVEIDSLVKKMQAAGTANRKIVDAVLKTGIVDEASDLLHRYGETLVEYVDVDHWVEEFKKCETADQYKAVFEDIGNSVVNSYYILEDNLEEAREDLDWGWWQIEDGWSQLNSSRETLLSAETEYTEGLITLETNKTELDKNEKLIEEKTAELEEGEKKYEEGIKQKEYFDIETGGIQKYDVAVINGGNNISVFTVKKVSEIFDNLKYSFALLFIIVGLLVCYSALSRLVTDQAMRIGTKKALGLKQSEITLGYMAYSGSALIIGTIVGLLIGVAINVIVITGLRDNYLFEKLVFNGSAIWAVIICLVEIILVVSVTWFSCRKVLKKRAVDLLKGTVERKARIRFFEKTGLWKKLPLIYKTIVNNCLNERRRVIGTIIGVMGCTALIVTAITFNRNVETSYETQVGRYWKYDTFVYIDDSVEEVWEETEKLLDSYGVPHVRAEYSQVVEKTPGGEYSFAYLMVPEDMDSYRQIAEVEEWKMRDADTYEGAWFSSAFANYYGVDAGYEMGIIETNGNEHGIVLDGFYTCYATLHQLTISPDTFVKYFDNEPEYNVFVMDTDGIDREALAADLLQFDGVVTVYDFLENVSIDYMLFSGFSGLIVGIYVFLSAVMAVLVLLNLMQMYVEEKKKELIVMMINGYSRKAARKYIYMDTIFLTVVGVILGVAAGSVAGILIVKSLCTASTVFASNIIWPACLIGAAGTAVLTAIMSAVSLKKIEKFELADINR